MVQFLLWYLTIVLVGLLALPVAYRFFPFLSDRGYTLARTLGLLLWGFFFWLLASLHILQNDIGGVLVALMLLAGLSLWASGGIKGWGELFEWLKGRVRLVAITEVLFLAAFAFLAVMRAASPDIAGTEKPMELAFINAILRSASFPPADPWLSGYAISYYYFGYVLVAILARFTGVSAGFAFNLGIALVFALTAIGSYGVVYTLLARWSRRRQEEGKRGLFSQGWALLAPLMILLISNLEGGFEVLHAQGAGWQQSNGVIAQDQESQFWSWLGLLELNQPPTSPLSLIPERSGGIWWWRASRVIQDYNMDNPLQEAIPGLPFSSYFPPASKPKEVIDEFPFFSFYLADLHPHVLAMPFGLLAIALALNLYLRGAYESFTNFTIRSWLKRPEFWLAATVLGGLAFLNIWDFPIYVALFAAAFTMVRFQHLGWRLGTRLKDFISLGIALGIAGILLYLPFYTGFASQAGGILPSLAFFTRGIHFWIMFGVLLAPIIGWLIWLARRQGNLHRFGAGLKVALGVTAALFVISYILGVLGLNLAAVGSLAQSGGSESLAGRVSLSLTNWGTLFLDLQGGNNAADILFGSLARRIDMPGTWVTLLFVLAGTWALLASFSPAKRPEETDEEAAEAPVRAGTSSDTDWAGTSSDTDRAGTSPAPTQWGDPHGFVLLLVLVGIGLTLIPEFIYLRDQFGNRMNTIFKFYFETWIVWGLAGAFAIAILWNELSRKPLAAETRRHKEERLGVVESLTGAAVRLALIVVMAGALVYPFFGIAQRLDFRTTADWTLDGTENLARFDPDEKGAMNWLSSAPYGVVVEAVGGSYGPAARMATHSGLPTVLGWPGHESQWRGGEQEKGSREVDISQLYRTRDWNEAKAILTKYAVRYIVVGGLEISTYRADDKLGLRAMDETKLQKNLKVAYQNSGVTIYEAPVYDVPAGKETQ